LSTQFFSFRIEPLEPLGNPLLLLCHQHRHLLSLLGPKSDRHPHCSGILR
jgi:hypothetical protein